MPLPVNLKCQGAGCYPRQPCLARGGEKWHHGWSQTHLGLNLGSSINYLVRISTSRQKLCHLLLLTHVSWLTTTCQARKHQHANLQNRCQKFLEMLQHQ
ncbi:hypothetical protein H8957_016455 [Semnopithecus entellus]